MDLIPKCYQHVFSESEILDLFPEKFGKDTNCNNKNTITLVPPVEIDRLTRVTSKYENFLTS